MRGVLIVPLQRTRHGQLLFLEQLGLGAYGLS